MVGILSEIYMLKIVEWNIPIQKFNIHKPQYNPAMWLRNFD